MRKKGLRKEKIRKLEKWAKRVAKPESGVVARDQG